MTTLSKPRQRFLFLLIAIVVLSTAFGMWYRYNTQGIGGKTNLEVATVFPQPRTITPFQLKDMSGKSLNIENLKGHYSLIFFGFTHCPDLCPTTLAMLNQSYKMMENAKLKTLPQVLFISVDPERDNSKNIKTYLSSFNTAFLGATGSKKQLDKLTQEMSVIYTKVANVEDPANYMIDHSGTILIVNPEGQFYGVFTMPHDPQKIAHDMGVLLNRLNA